MDLAMGLRRNYGLDLNYHFAYNAKDLGLKEIHGNVKFSYHRLVHYVDCLIQGNPNSYVVLEKEPDKKFKRLFVALGACVHGFSFCCPLLFLDGTFLTGCFKGCLLAATGKNGNGGFLPIIGIVDSENNDNWLWFFYHLKAVLGVERRFTFLSDRHHGLVKNIPLVFPNSFHGFCLWHLKANLKAAISIAAISIKNPLRVVLITLFESCAYAATPLKYKDKIVDFIRIGGTVVNEFLVDLDPEKWANVFFKGNCRG